MFSRILILGIFLYSSIGSGEVKDLADIDLESAILDFQKLQITINQILQAPKTNCGSSSDNSFDRCKIINYCDKFQAELNKKNLYEKNDGIIVNDSLLSAEKDLISCLRANYADDISIKVSEFSNKAHANHLREVYDLNQKILTSIKKHNEGNALAIFNQEMVKLELRNAINQTEINTSYASKLTFILKDKKIKLSAETIKLLIALEEKNRDLDYQAETKKFQASLFAPINSSSLFSNLENFTNVEVAGSKKQLLLNQKKYNEKAQSTFNVFSEVKNNYIVYLTSIKTAENKEQVDRAIERIKLVKFKTPVLGEDFKQQCQSPNAWYAPDSNSLITCPGWFDRPPIVLYETFAHELSHSIDPCNFPAPMKINSYSADVVEDGPFAVDLKMPEVKASQVIYGSLGDDKLKSSDQNRWDKNNNPFKNVITCLQEEKSVGAKVVDGKKISQSIDQQLDYLNNLGRNNNTDTYAKYLNYTKNNWSEFEKTYGYCNLNLNHNIGQLEEAFADKMASELVAKKLSTMSNDAAKNEMEKLILNELNNDDIICKDSKALEQIKDHAVRSGCENYFANKNDVNKLATGIDMASKFNQDAHPPLSKRLDRIILMQPKIREVLNCKASDGKYCEN